MKKIIFILLLISILISNKIYSQRQANIWYFGEYAGLDFNSGKPIPLTDGVLSCWEGVATMSDSTGKLLLYTDGENVWNAQHKIMPNGQGLFGNQSSTECAIIVPMPLHQNLYYIITVDYEAYQHGLCYSLVDMNLDNGNGDVTNIKNVQLVTPVSEKITAIPHQNNKDFWLVAHGFQTDSFFVYKITENGLNETPNIYQTGTQHTDIAIWGANAIGYMRLAPNGKKLAAAIMMSQMVDILNFNNLTGEVTIELSLFEPGGGTYGVEFSPDCSKLYITSKFSLFQIDLNAGTTEDIINSYTLIGSSQTDNYFGALQLGTDGKIYLAHEFSDYLGVINNPNADAANCNFVLKGLYLNGRTSRMGLPDFIPSFFLPPDFKYNITCEGDSTQFYLASTSNVDSVAWNFGDINSGTQNTSKLLAPKHLFTTAGNYFVQLSLFIDGVEYPKKQIVRINALPYVNLGNDTIICADNTLTLNAVGENLTYLWNNSTTDSILNISKPGTYFVKVQNKYILCKNADTIKVDYAKNPIFSLGNDTSFCINDSLKIGLNYPKANFLWNTNQTDSFIYIKNIGKYILQITDSLGCKNKDSIIIKNYNLPIVNLGNDTTICPETEIFLSSWQNGATYLWNDNSTNSSLIVQKTDTIWLELTDKNKCKNIDSVIISQSYFPEVKLQNDTSICEDIILLLSPKTKYVEKSNYLWNNNSTDTILYVSKKGDYILNVKNICGEASDTVFVIYKYCGEVSIPNIITPNNDNINDYFFIKGIENQTWRLEIYNRWGNKIFETNNYQNDWNADKNPDGVYYYIFSNSEYNKTYNGQISVYR